MPGSATIDLEPYFDLHRQQLTGYCYRMLGSPFDADDAVQETLVRTWLYRIATNVCLDMLRRRKRRVRPMELGPSRSPDLRHLDQGLGEESWVLPTPDRAVLGDGADPAEAAVLRDSVRLAFVAALQHLPAKQRAAVLLCDVLRWPAAETAELLDTSVASVNSALQRARATLADLDAGERPTPADPEQAALLDRYLEAFERYDVPALVTLLREDAVQSMPPYAMWLEGA